MKTHPLVGLALALCLSFASAQSPEALPPHRIAVVSLIGDRLTLVTWLASTGTHLPANAQEVLPVHDIFFDRGALQAAKAAIQAADPTASTALMAFSGEEAYAAQGAMLVDQRFVAPAWLAAELAGEKATHLLLLTRLRADAHFPIVNGHVGEGKVEGLGFYVDYRKRLFDPAIPANGIGFIAPFACFKLSLIEVSTSAVLAQKLVSTGFLLNAARDEKGGDPWRAMTAQAKVAAIERLVKRQVAEAVPGMWPIR
jgi:hypothetical protein